MNKKNFLFKDNEKFEYKTPHWGRILAARFFDVLIMLPFLLIIYYFSWKNLPEKNIDIILRAMLVFLSQVLLIIYFFVLIPWVLKGRTLSKVIFKLYLIQENVFYPTFKNLLIRESYFLIIPAFVEFLCKIIGLELNLFSKDPIVFIIYNFGQMLSSAWYIVLLISIWAQPNKLSWIDIKLKNKVLHVIKIEIMIKDFDDKVKIDEMPFVVSKENLKEIMEEEND
ncbi:RDD family protein [Spiroplasma endosymbiont of Crioceris asparagi]|uniref:RDD family protein n=1 Tax=Spiroplasma endosymbiont of Crioceris asparagi TaxID=3066286 RepID=UPI0030D1B00C